ncbi:phosphotransferase [Erysipelothrix sp. HDW6C]|uniref:choline kinase family protein n=1 Tax=Erysipelothrix sp. HDW6C TaxID=2714930 RepID=UPI001409068A|nr:choline kinase family protein [Erysipelothrix sp. HDW6C]QIK70113.1 phosphotransferase [Erysipelothrix sp. HDW6C]
MKEIFDTLNLGVAKNVSKLGGLTNKNYRVETLENDFVVRLPGKDTDKIIDRADEATIVKAIEPLGIDAPLTMFDDVSGLKICEHIPGAITMNTKMMQEPHYQLKVAHLLKTLHKDAPNVPVKFDVLEMIERYERTIKSASGYLPQDYETTKTDIVGIQKAYDDPSIVDVLSHNDPLPENFILSSDGGLYLVDWEYGGMNSPYWDVADVSIESAYDFAQDERFLHAYLGHKPTSSDWHQFNLNKLYIDLLWSLWGYVRETLKEEHEVEDFIMYGNDRFARLKRNLRKFKESIN